MLTRRKGCKSPTQRLNDTNLTPEGEYSINFIKEAKKFCLSQHCNGRN